MCVRVLTSVSVSKRVTQCGGVFRIFRSPLFFLQGSSFFIFSPIWCLISIPLRISLAQEASRWDSRVFYNHS